ncbi:MAG: hypothetical protein A2138_07850 [Deltaproteobacteria bacterium RBG_16_71_12]|nr:MAG: hypothetical protein A2138_07850 [Deltaproteobacteria bacterium RBG_16_71_12]
MVSHGAGSVEQSGSSTRHGSAPGQLSPVKWTHTKPASQSASVVHEVGTMSQTDTAAVGSHGSQVTSGGQSGQVCT